MNATIHVLFLLLSATSTGLCVLQQLGLDNLLQADVIARVTIVSISDSASEPGYTKLAQALVTDAAKGV